MVEPEEEDRDSSRYSGDELQRNRRNIFLGTFGFILISWMTADTLNAAVALTVVGLLGALILVKLFATRSASKLGDDFAGSGKQVHPRTMGTVLGYLFRGFHHDE